MSDIQTLFAKYGVRYNSQLPIHRGPGELRELLALLPPGSTVAEVGAYAGAATVLFAEKADLVFAIDPWQPGYDNSDISSRVNGQLIEDIFDLRTHCLNNVVKLKMTSELAASFHDTFTMVYIDADHRYESVKKDISLWLPKTTILAGHDYNWPAVKKAVDEIGQVMVVDGCNWVHIP